jgi:hypothetical protein
MAAVREDLRLALDRVSFAERLGIVPDLWQGRLMRSAAPRVILNISRQAGKSTAAAVIALHRALYHPGALVLILAPSERQAKETFSKITGFYCDLAPPGASFAPAKSDRKLGMLLSNGSRVEALPGSERTIRGFSGVDLLLVDEAARVPDELYYAVRPMLAVSGGRLLLLSTPYGKRGAFFEAWEHGVGWERYEVPASQCPRISETFLEEERRSLPARVFRQEFECSFEDVDDAVFTYDLVHGAVSEDVSPLQFKEDEW